MREAEKLEHASLGRSTTVVAERLQAGGEGALQGSPRERHRSQRVSLFGALHSKADERGARCERSKRVMEIRGWQ